MRDCWHRTPGCGIPRTGPLGVRSAVRRRDQFCGGFGRGLAGDDDTDGSYLRACGLRYLRACGLREVSGSAVDRSARRPAGRWPNSVIDTPQMKSSLRLLMRWHLRPEHGSELHDLRVIDSASSANDDRAEFGDRLPQVRRSSSRCVIGSALVWSDAHTAAVQSGSSSRRSCHKWPHRKNGQRGCGPLRSSLVSFPAPIVRVRPAWPPRER
jgi:hypothetical protein